MQQREQFADPLLGRGADALHRGGLLDGKVQSITGYFERAPVAPAL